MGKPFRVTIDLGGSEVGFDMTEDYLDDRAKQRDIRLAAELASAPGRDGYRRAAYHAVRHMLDEKDPDKVIKVHENNSATITMIPLKSVRFVVLRDPEAGDEERPFGFADPVPATPEGSAKVTPIKRPGKPR